MDDEKTVFPRLAVAQPRRHPVNADDARLSILTRDNRAMLQNAADLEHDRSGVHKERRPARIGRVGDDDISPVDRLFTRVMQHLYRPRCRSGRYGDPDEFASLFLTRGRAENAAARVI